MLAEVHTELVELVVLSEALPVLKLRTPKTLPLAMFHTKRYSYKEVQPNIGYRSDVICSVATSRR